MDRFDLGEGDDTALGAPGEEVGHATRIGAPGMGIADGGDEKFEEMLLRPLIRRSNDRGQLQRGRGEGGQPGHGTTPMLAAP